MRSATHTSLAGRLNTLTVDGSVDGDGAVLLPRGDLVHGCTDILARSLARLPDGVRRVDLDMSGVAFMDTAGLQFLEVLDTWARRRHARVSATGWTEQPRGVLEMAGLDPDDPLHGPGTRRETVPSVVVLERTQQLDKLRTEVEQLRQAIASRPVIDQARGVLMATHACSPDQAWDVLREASQLSNTKLRKVAAVVAAGAGGGGPVPSPELRRALRTAIDRCLD
ncbi:ANTAR domain-containing response regulator [Streptomyces sp. NRRL B-24085]|uniref:ANTAR domain-containing response regulator n=1 Tax=Streptomyces sp. NRRL B-24085 TaxID=1709476 RepID=UPI0006B37F14|nr:ANTAR domain-containing protein [Streptomyces sp. NRRL B-24085]